MKFKSLKSNKLISIATTNYSIDWDSPSKSKLQRSVKLFLSGFWKTDDVLEEFPIPQGILRLDFLNLSRKIAVEVSPSSSHSYNKFFHKNRNNFLSSVKRDDEKIRWCKLNGIQLVCLQDVHLKNISKEMFLEEFGITL